MGTATRLLIIEGNKNDAQLLLGALGPAGDGREIHCVSGVSEAVRALEGSGWDLVVCNFRLPDGSGLDVLGQIQTTCPSPPVIMVSETIDEEAVISSIRAGAADFAIKDNTVRLVAAVGREVARRGEEHRGGARSAAGSAVEEELQRLRAVIQAGPVTMSWVSSELTYLGANAQMLSLLGCTETELLGKPVGYLGVNPRYRQFVETLFRVEQEQYSDEVPMTVDEHHYDFYLVGRKFLDGRQAVIIGLNITERKQAEEAIRESDAHLKDILDSVSVGIMVVDPEDHRILESNAAACRMVGRSREEIVGKTCHGFVCPSEKGRCPITDMNQTVDCSQRVVLTADGRKVPILKSVVPVVRNGRKYLIENFFDISEMKDTERKLKETVAELEKFNRLAIGRELRMIELKLEVNRMARKANESPPYDLSFADNSGVFGEVDGGASPAQLASPEVGAN